MMRMTHILAFAAAVLLSVPAFANDAGSGGGDAGSTSDAVGTPNPATDTSFNVNPCWDEKCASETAACKADAACSKFIACMKTGKGAQECSQGLSQAEGEAVNKLLTPLQECGWKACADPTAGTCKDQCGKYLGRSAKCQCDSECEKYGDCCADYKELCGGGSTQPEGSCKDKCGTPYDQSAPCQCDSECEGEGDCCPDYKELCSKACTPSCVGKKCGDDGCGGVCGTCPVGTACDATGQCQADNTGADAGSSDDAGAGGTTDAGSTTDAGTAADTGAGGGTSSTAKKDSGGCTAGATSNGALPMMLVLFGLVGAVISRRRFI